MNRRTCKAPGSLSIPAGLPVGVFVVEFPRLG